jgi:hypothetical protein
MAEQFILPDAKSSVIKVFVKNVKCTITDLAHANVGWTAASRGQYDGLMGLNGQPAIVGRNGLPPHFYIEIPVNNNPSLTDLGGLYAGSGDLIRGLSRGVVPAVLKALTDGDNDWKAGRKPEAVIKEMKRGNVSISIYHLDGEEVGQTHRDKVAKFEGKV